MSFERPQFNIPEQNPEQSIEGFSERIATLRASLGHIDEVLAQVIAQELDVIDQGKAGPDDSVAEQLSNLEKIVIEAYGLLEPTGDYNPDLESMLEDNRKQRGVGTDTKGGEYKEAA